MIQAGSVVSGPSVAEGGGAQTETNEALYGETLKRPSCLAVERNKDPYKHNHPSESLSRSYVWAGQFSCGWMIYGSSQQLLPQDSDEIMGHNLLLLLTAMVF